MDHVGRHTWRRVDNGRVVARAGHVTHEHFRRSGGRGRR